MGVLAVCSEPECASIPCDPPLSKVGEKQVAEVSAQLIADDFVRTVKMELVAHSELKRARDTCEALFRSWNIPMQELGILNECHFTDFDCYCVPGFRGSRTFAARVEQTRAWLASRTEHVIGLVAHGRFFKTLQRGSGAIHFHNVEIRRCIFDVASLTVDAGTTLYCPGDLCSDIDSICSEYT